MQADVILKEPPSWVPPLSLSGGAHVEGGGGARPPLVRPCPLGPEIKPYCNVFYIAEHQTRTYFRPDMVLHIHSRLRSLLIFHLLLLLILVDTTLLHYL